MNNLRWVLAPFLAVAVALAVACGGSSGDDGDASPPQSQTGVDRPAGETLSVASLASSLEAIESFRFDMKLSMDFEVPEGSTGDDAAAAALFMALLGNIEAEGAYVAPDSYEMAMTLFGMNVQTVQIGDESWTNDGSGWVADTGGGSALGMPFDLSSPADLPFEFIPEQELAGAETSSEKVNGFETTRYHFDKDSLTALAETAGETAGLGDLSALDTMNLDIWLTDEGIPVKMKLEVAGENEGADIAIDFEFNITDFNDPGIIIERPI